MPPGFVDLADEVWITQSARLNVVDRTSKYLFQSAMQVKRIVESTMGYLTVKFVKKIDDYWYLYYDAYRRHQYEGVRSKDLKNWESITDKLFFPPGTRHGTALIVEDEVLAKLLELK